jgi:hypothetical protein
MVLLLVGAAPLFGRRCPRQYEVWPGAGKGGKHRMNRAAKVNNHSFIVQFDGARKRTRAVAGAGLLSGEVGLAYCTTMRCSSRFSA